MTSDDAVQAVVDGLNSVGIPFMVVGSFSSNVYGLARSTQDADIVVQLQPGQIQQLIAVHANGLRVDPQPRFETVTMTTYFVLHTRDGKFRIELFVLSDDPHDQTRFARRVQGMVAGRSVWVPTAEDVIITKIRWYGTDRRNQDWDDVRNVIAVQQTAWTGTTSTIGATFTVPAIISTPSESRSNQLTCEASWPRPI